MVQRVFAASLNGRVPKPMGVAFRWFLKDAFQSQSSELGHRLPWRERTLLETKIHALEQIVANFGDINFVDRKISVSWPVH